MKLFPTIVKSFFMMGRVKVNHLLMSTSNSSVGPIHPLQTIFNELAQLEDLSSIVQTPLNNQNLAIAFRAMNDVTLSHLGIGMSSFQGLKYPLCLSIAEHPKFHIAAFLLPKKYHMTLHDHPHMIVCSKMLAGKVQLRSFSGRRNGDKITGTVALDEIRSHLNNPWFLTPETGNYHEITALEDSVMLDLLLPPYDEEERSCTFYRSQPLPSPDNQALFSIKPLTALELSKVSIPYSSPYKGFRPG